MATRIILAILAFFGVTPLEARKIALSFLRALIGGLTIALIGWLTGVLDGSNTVIGTIAAATVTSSVRALQIRHTEWESPSPSPGEPDVGPTDGTAN